MVKAELPGMKEEDIDVSLVGDTLTVRGERKAETEVQVAQRCSRLSPRKGSWSYGMTLLMSGETALVESENPGSPFFAQSTQVGLRRCMLPIMCAPSRSWGN